MAAGFISLELTIVIAVAAFILGAIIF